MERPDLRRSTTTQGSEGEAVNRAKCLYCERPESMASARGTSNWPLCGLHGNAWVQAWTGRTRGTFLDAVKRVRPVEETLTAAESSSTT